MVATDSTSSTPEEVGGVGPADGEELTPELDDLLTDDKNGGGEPGEADRYDFNRLNTISKNFEQQLRNISENFAKGNTITLTNLFRVNASLEFSGLELQPCSEFVGTLTNPTCIATVGLSPLKGHCLVYLDLPLAFSMLKKLMGGSAEATETVREFTEIEEKLTQTFIMRLLEGFTAASARLLEITPSLDTLENNPDYLTGIATGDTLVKLSFLFKVDTLEGNLVLGLPFSSFEPVMEIFDPEEEIELRTPQELRRERRQILDLVKGTSSLVVARLAEVEMNLEAVVQLEVGDLLHLPQPVDAPLQVEVAGKPIFLGEAGRVRQNRAVKLVERIGEE